MLRVLQLSDLHYGLLKDGKSSHRYVDANGAPDPKKLAEILVRGVSEPPDVVIVSGDVGWSGTESDYRHAASFFQQLRTSWERAPFVIAPGNHDVDQSRPGERQTAFIEFVRTVQGARFDEQYPLLKDDPTNRRKLVAFERIQTEDDDLLVVAVNSAAYLEGMEDKEGKEDKSRLIGFAEPELRAIEDQIKLMGPSERTLRLFVLHHALFPFSEAPWSNTIDASAINEKPDLTIVANSATLQGWLAEHSFQIVLHGHKHLMHGRKDTLFRGDDPPEGRQLFVVGAGSSGVEQKHLPHLEPLSFNLLTITRLAHARWAVDVSVRHVIDRLQPLKEAHKLSVEVGNAAGKAPLVFHAETMADCHRAIWRSCSGKKESEAILCNFVSVVESFEVVESREFLPPSTARFRGGPVTKKQIERTFKALHPEYDRTTQWQELSRLDSALREASPRFQFQHGPRLFTKPHGADRSPIVSAVDQISEKNLDSDAYASLYKPELDVAPSKSRPVPHLMSIQFIREGESLDAVVTFRKIELSYWWVANMYEVALLLQWAAKERGKALNKTIKARRITFFAALAEWKDNPEAAFAIALDEMPLEEMARLVAELHDSNGSASAKLMELLKEKRSHTNENNLDPAGVSMLKALLVGFSSSKPGGKARQKSLGEMENLIKAITKAADCISSATTAKEKSPKTEEARRALAEAIQLLGGSPDGP